MNTSKRSSSNDVDVEPMVTNAPNNNNAIIQSYNNGVDVDTNDKMLFISMKSNMKQ